MNSMKKRRNNKVQSLKSVSLKLLIPVGIAVAGLLLFLFIGLNENNRLADEYVRDTAKLYVDQINRDIAQMDSELVYILEQNEAIDDLSETIKPQDAKSYPIFFRIMNQNRILKIRYREVQKFYVYAKSSDVLITGDGIIFPDSMKMKLYEELTGVLKEQPENSQMTNWKFLHIAEKSYIVSWYFKDGKGLGCIINLNTIFDDLQNVIEKYQAIPFVKDTEGQIIMSDNLSKEMQDKILSLDGTEDELYVYQLGGVGQIYLYIVPDSGMLERILYIQMLFTIFLLMLVVLSGILLYVYYEKILSPMKRFVDQLEQMNEEQLLNENGNNNILELEFASDKFRMLLRKVKSLKIAIYEKELQEQRAELEYVQEQLRPHFLLNCLSIIHGKADEKGEQEIVHITEMLSDYMRYIMRDSKNRRSIKEELQHIGAYVSMQKLRYGEGAFSYEVMLDADVEDCLLPPLLLQILVENSIVHQVSLDRKIDISLYITIENYGEEEYLYICISDTGNGFSAETLLALKNDTPIVYNGRKHVGLQNIQRRLSLMYGGKASIDFSNMDENYGAVVEVRIPLNRKDEQEECQ